MPLITARFVQSAQDFLDGIQTSQMFWESTILFCGVLIVPTMFSGVNEIINSLIEAKCCQIFGKNLFDKTKRISQVSFEDSKVYDKYNLANRAASGQNSYQCNAIHLSLIHI